MLSTSSLLLSPYFIVNYALILVYPIIQMTTNTNSRSLKLQDNFGFTYQNSIIYTVLALAMISYTRSTSNEQFFLDAQSACKIGVACLLLITDLVYGAWYIAICLVVWAIVPYPKLKSPNKFIHIREQKQFQDLLAVRCPEAKEKPKFLHFQYRTKTMYFVEFYADWNLTCTFAKQLWYGYSNKYTTNQLKFLSINVSRLPDLAKKYQINTTGFSKQLPTIMIIEDGEEKLRFPPIDKNNKVAKVAKYNYRILLRYFDLESRYLETRS